MSLGTHRPATQTDAEIAKANVVQGGLKRGHAVCRRSVIARAVASKRLDERNSCVRVGHFNMNQAPTSDRRRHRPGIRLGIEHHAPAPFHTHTHIHTHTHTQAHTDTQTRKRTHACIHAHAPSARTMCPALQLAANKDSPDQNGEEHISRHCGRVSTPFEGQLVVIGGIIGPVIVVPVGVGVLPLAVGVTTVSLRFAASTRRR